MNERKLQELSVRELCLHISEKHHKYELSQLSSIKVHLGSSVKIDGAKFPNIKASWEIFSLLEELLENHLQKEEQLLFPFAEELNSENKNKPVSLIEKPLKKLKKEHEKILGVLVKLRKINDGYKPEPACSPTGKLSMLEMEELEIDVKRSIDVEENILFPLLLKMQHDLGASRTK